jgi:hypothetical protein
MILVCFKWPIYSILIRTVVHAVVQNLYKMIYCFCLLLKNRCIHAFTDSFEVNTDLQATVLVFIWIRFLSVIKLLTFHCIRFVYKLLK